MNTQQSLIMTWGMLYRAIEEGIAGSTGIGGLLGPRFIRRSILRLIRWTVVGAVACPLNPIGLMIHIRCFNLSGRVVQLRVEA